MQIRAADPDRDAAACAAIYAPYVRDTAVSFEEVPPGEAEFAARIARIAASHLYLVAEDDDGIAGFAYAGGHRERPAYRWACETSVYVEPRRIGRGIGRALYDALLPGLVERGLWIALAGITLPNPASVALHERCGFRHVGVYERVGWKAGAWRDVGWWQLHLRADEGPPSAH